MLHNPYKIVKMFEEEVAHYTGAPFAVSTDSCTDALLLCCDYLKVNEVTIPAHTYLSVPQSIIHAGGVVNFEEREWKGVYQLKPYPIYDAAKRFTSGMYIPGSYMILTDNIEAYEWFKKGRYEGRTEVKYHDDNIDINGWNAYMTPEQAARGLMLIQNLPRYNDDLPEEPQYRDLREFEMFKEKE